MTTTNSTVDLQTLRRAIDGIDDALARLLATRVQLSHQAQDLKRQHRLPALDRAREAEIANRYERQWCGAGTVARSILNLCHED